jgi:hypothetical protein
MNRQNIDDAYDLINEVARSLEEAKTLAYNLKECTDKIETLTHRMQNLINQIEIS